MSTPNPPKVPSVTSWHVPPRNQGQIVEIAFGVDDGSQPWMRVTDRSIPEVSYTAGKWAEPFELSRWEPWNSSPSRCVVWSGEDLEPEEDRLFEAVWDGTVDGEAFDGDPADLW